MKESILANSARVLRFPPARPVFFFPLNECVRVCICVPVDGRKHVCTCVQARVKKKHHTLTSRTLPVPGLGKVAERQRLRGVTPPSPKLATTTNSHSCPASKENAPVHQRELPVSPCFFSFSSVFSFSPPVSPASAATSPALPFPLLLTPCPPATPPSSSMRTQIY